ncbi:MAG: AMP-binding protein [Synergistaceae bacterium]
MPRDFSKTRLEEIFVTAWQGKENEDCIWWQGEWWTWNRLNDLALDCEEKLKNSGFTEGQRLILLLPNSPMVFALSIAAWRLGGAVAPLNMRTGLVNMFNTIRKLDPHSIIIHEDAFEKASEASKTIGVPIVSAKPDSPLNEWIGRIGQTETKDYAILFSTSGTSGNPKAIGCYHSNLIDNISQLPDSIPGLLAEDAVFLNVLPNFHTFGNNVAGLLPLMCGVRQTIVPTFVPVENTIKAIKDSGVTAVIAVPTVIAFLLGALAKKEEQLKGIRHVVSGGDRLNTQLDERCKKYMGVGILEGYGLTECSPVVAVSPSEETKKLGTVGPLLKSYEAKVTDREGNPIGLHDEGVLWVKGPSVAPCYFRDKENTAERFDGDWFNTGDVVQIDEDGYIKIVDRATDIIIVSGFNVYPQEVEAVLCEHPYVHAAIAVGEKNNVAGEMVKAFIILNENGIGNITPKELMSYCKERLAHYKVPRKIGFVTEYPLSPTGKVLRRELRKIKIERAN